MARARILTFPLALASALLAFQMTSGSAVGQDVPLALTVDDPKLKWGPCPDFMPKGCQIAVLQGDPAKHNADVFFRIPGKSHVPRHWHTSAERMALVAGELDIAFDGHPRMNVRQGSYLYGPAKLPHEVTCVSSDPCVLFIAFESPVDAIPGGPEDKAR